MVARDIALLERTGGRLHVAHAQHRRHASTWCAAPRRAASPVTAEVTPHHFTLTEEAVGELRHQRQDEPAAAHARADVEALHRRPARRHDRRHRHRPRAASPRREGGRVRVRRATASSAWRRRCRSALRLVREARRRRSTRWCARSAVDPARILGVPGGSLAAGQRRRRHRRSIPTRAGRVDAGRACARSRATRRSAAGRCTGARACDHRRRARRLARRRGAKAPRKRSASR